MVRSVSKVHGYLKNRTKLVRKRSIHRLKLFLNYQLNKGEKEPVFIITTRRTGSNLFLEHLNSIPQASFASEILNQSMYYGLRSRFISKKTVLRHIAYSINACKENVCGAKIVKMHLEHHRITLEDLREYFPRARFVILYRRSLVDQFLSFKIAETTDTWRWTDQFRLPSSLEISVTELLEYCKMTKRFYWDIFDRSWLKERALALSYEELVGSPQETFERVVFPFLKLPVSKVTSTARKQNTKKLHEIVHNYQEIIPWIGHPLTTQSYSSPGGEENRLTGESRIMAG